MEDRVSKHTILVDDWGLENALKDEGKIGLENALFKLVVEGLETHSKMKGNRAGKRTILIGGRGSENTLEDEGK